VKNKVRRTTTKEEPNEDIKPKGFEKKKKGVTFGISELEHSEE